MLMKIMEPKVIRTEAQYHSYLEEIQYLMEDFPALGSPESDRIELLTVLLEDYENKLYPIEASDPIDAILFRMHEKSLKQADLTQYFGTKSRVSEVLSRKRPLTVQMIRALSIGLGISADTLISLPKTESSSTDEINWDKFPIKEIMSRGWIQKASTNIVESTEEAVKQFISSVGLQFGSASFKRTIGGEAYAPSTKYTLFAWLARVVQKAREQKNRLGVFNKNNLSTEFIKELSQFSGLDNGPLLAVDFLRSHGIAVVFEPSLKGALLDGAALKDKDGMPIIGLTLRHDRLDNFWFTLMHEVVHIWKHVDGGDTFFDDLDASSEDRREAEANRLAREAYIPRIIWKRSSAFINPSKDSIDAFARELKIHPAIVAGRLRWETQNYSSFNELVGHGEVRKMFM